ncbi:MAG: hypothetical protein JSV65_09145 [Armatimonadota bacterium]|nr:MAG: hypothetical protein JSV65_09145 [Armatimonadota bacterium]
MKPRHKAPRQVQYILLATLGSLLVCPGAFAEAADVSLSNRYLSAEVTGATVTSLRVDPHGRGRYGANLVRAVYAGDVPAPESVRWERPTEHTLSADAAPFYVRRDEYVQSRRDRADRLNAGRTLGQSFSVAEAGLAEVGACFPTWYQVGPSMTLTLRRGGPGGEAVASRRFYGVHDNSWQRLIFPPQPAGAYYLEITLPAGTIGWWTSDEDVYPGGTAYADGEPVAGCDRAFSFSRFDVARGRLEITLAGRRLAINAEVAGAQPRFYMVTPWQLTGYDTSEPATCPFSAFISDRGQYVPAAQLKRRATMDFAMLARHWIRARGNGDFDLLFSPFAGSLVWTMENDAMTLALGPQFAVEVQPAGGVPDFYPEFFSSDPRLGERLNPFLYERAFSWPLDPGLPDWMEWVGTIRDWIALPGYLERERAHLLTYKMDDDGYVYTWGERQEWPFPDNEKYDARHFTTNAMFVLGCWRYYCWTGDVEFVRENLARLRAAMRFQLADLRGGDGLLIMTSPDHDGTSKGLHSNYWDDIPFGYKSAYENIYFYASLEAMAQMLDAAGDAAEARRLRALRERVRRRYNEEFWDDSAGRYIGCVDRTGQRHDYGFTYVNTEALAYGLGSREQARRVYHWMETEPTQSGKADTYSAYRFAPRANTFDCSGWWYLEGKAEIPSQPWAKHLENGGAILYTSYYDILARARLISADSAYQRLLEILDRYAEPDRLCGGSPLYYGEVNGWEVGTDVPFPESGLVPAVFLYAFLGIEAQGDGLHIRPNLPTALKFAGVRNLLYRGLQLDIRVTRDAVEITCRDPGSDFHLRKPITRGGEYVFRQPPRGRFPPRRTSSWDAAWIWTPGQWRVEGSTCHARRVFDIAGRPTRADISIAADNSYRLYVNGEFVGAGGGWETVERRDIASQVQPGRNVIAVACANADGPGGLLAQAAIEVAGQEPVRLATGQGWRVAADAPDGWTEVGFDDSAWQAAEVIARPPGGPWGEIEPASSP